MYLKTLFRGQVEHSTFRLSLTRFYGEKHARVLPMGRLHYEEF